jgi:hypothetical protein
MELVFYRIMDYMIIISTKEAHLHFLYLDTLKLPRTGLNLIEEGSHIIIRFTRNPF